MQMQKIILLLLSLLLFATFSFSQLFSFYKGGTSQTNYYSVIPYENVMEKLLLKQ
jgi:hypothetical protein